MKKELLFIAVLTSNLLFSQIQIGSDISGEEAKDEFGTSVSLSSDGSIVAVGGPNNDGNSAYSGHVRIYVNNNGAWEQIGSDIDGETSSEDFGKSVSLSSDGSIVAIGAPNKDVNGTNSGHVRIYQNESGTWTLIGSIDGATAGDKFGVDVSLSADGSVVAIGGPNNDVNGTDSGHVRVYRNNSGTWTQIGTDIYGVAAGGKFGINVRLSSDGSILAIADTDTDGNSVISSHVRVYRNTSGTWTQIGADIDSKLAGNFTESRKSLSSLSLSSDGTIIAIGSVQNNSGGTHLDYVSIYRNTNGAWEKIGSDIGGEATGDQFGRSVSLSSDGNTVAIGGPWNTPSAGVTHSGHVRIYQNKSGVWTQMGPDIDGRVTNNLLGASVSLSSDGSTVAIGGPDNNGYDNHLGHVRIFNLSAVLSIHKFVESNTKLYPNPATNKFTIKLNEKLHFKKASMYNTMGNLILTTTDQTIEVKKISKGLYVLIIVTDKGKTVKKIIIN